MYVKCELLESSQSNQNVMLSVETKHEDEVRGLPASVGFNTWEPWIYVSGSKSLTNHPTGQTPSSALNKKSQQ